MNKIKNKILLFLALAVAFIPSRSFAIFDIGPLIQIAVNTAQQLQQLKSILEKQKGTLDILESVNQGINDTFILIRTMNPNTDPGLYGDWEKAQATLRKLQTIYGIVVPSPDSQIQKDTDQNVIEAVALNNSIYSYSRDIDQVGEQIKDLSRQTSPKGAQRLTAQTLGIMLHVLNTSLRAQATGLKLQAQTLAIQNHKEKEGTKKVLQVSNELATAIKDQDSGFNLPRFQ